MEENDLEARCFWTECNAKLDEETGQYVSVAPDSCGKCKGYDYNCECYVPRVRIRGEKNG